MSPMPDFDTSAASHAIRLIGRGLRVFRIARGTKNGFIDRDWAHRQLDDGFDAFEAFDAAAMPDKYNVGVATGASGLVVVDVDVKDGVPVETKLAALAAEWPHTLTVRTPSGGLHLYFDACGQKFGQRPLAHGVDIRATNGYVLGPGSAIGGKAYDVEVDAPIAPLPAWLAERLNAAPEKKSTAGQTVAELDTVANDDAALRMLTALPVALGGGRDEAAYRVAERCMDLGLSPERTVVLMCEHFRADPPLDGAEVQKVCHNAELYRKDAIGCDAPERIADGFSAVPAEFLQAKTPFWHSAEQWIGVDPEPQPWVIESIVPAGLVTLLVSGGGVGKSALAMQMIACVAAGKPFLGYATAQGAAGGVFSEDRAERLNQLSKGMCAGLGADFRTVAPHMYPRSMLSEDAVLWTAQGRTMLLDDMRAAVAATPNLKLLVVDGASNAFDGNEISRREVRAFVDALGAIAKAHMLGVVLITHESKASTYDDDDNPASGSTAWKNSCRSVLRLLTLKGDRRAPYRILRHIKCNVGPEMPPVTTEYRDCFFTVTDDAAPVADAAADYLGSGPLSVKALAKLVKTNEGGHAASALSTIERWLTKPFKGLMSAIDLGERGRVVFVPSGTGGGEFHLE
jgi:AAA domain/Bifunctional DNA primase/polymerase, N-terminal